MEKIDYVLDKTSILEKEIEFLHKKDSDMQSSINNADVNINALQSNQSKILDNLSNSNMLINGDFRVNQRGFSTTSSANTYTVDRWKNDNVNAKVTLNADKSITLQNINSNGNTGYFIQMIDPDEMKMWGNTYTMSCKFSDGKIISKTMTFPVSFSNAMNIGVSEAYSNINLRGFLYNQTKFGFTVDIGANANATILWCKLEEGGMATKFSAKLYTEELENCRRYYEKIDVSVSANRYNIYKIARNSSSFYDGQVQFMTVKRVRPTITLYSTYNTPNCLRNSSQSNAEQAFSVSYITDNGYLLTNTNGNMATNDIIIGYYSADAEIY